MQSTKTQNKSMKKSHISSSSIYSVDSNHSDRIRTNDEQTSNKLSAETLALCEMTEQITSASASLSIGDRLYYAIHPIQPKLAGKITAMFLNSVSRKELQHLLDNSSSLQPKIDEAMAVLKNDQSNLYSQYKRNCDDIKHQFTCNKNKNSQHAQPVILSGTSTPTLQSVSMIETASRSSCNSSIHYLSSPNRSISKLETISSRSDLSSTHRSLQTTSHKDKDNAFRMPSTCTVRTVRVIIDAPIAKPMLQLTLQKKCIPNPTAQCFQQIYTRCHKSYYHNNYTTVAYIHFVNFKPKKYLQCYKELFSFTNNTLNLINLMGNQFGMIQLAKCFQPVKEYPMMKVPVEYLSKMVRICLRCKLSEAEPRKRVCKYCIADEINDRKKIAEYYKNPKNKANLKSYFAIQNDFIHLLKIEPHLIPTPMYRTDCKSKNTCTKKCCTYVHNRNEKNFGWKLWKIQKDTEQKRYASVMSQYQLSDYQTVGLQFRYRRIICDLYEKNWKCCPQIIHNEHNMNKIVQHLNNKRVKLHLIPLVYKSNCREDKCRTNRGKKCSFVHGKNDRIFGDMLWEIKCIAKNKFETESVHSNHSICDEKELLFDDDEEEEKHYEWNRSAIEREWGYAIRPYKEAVNDERDAETKELNQWSINGANIEVQIQCVNRCESVRKRIYELYVIYEDDKDAKITLNRTYIRLLFPCVYDVGLRTVPVPVPVHGHNNGVKQRRRQCPACYFNICGDQGEHWQLENDRMVLVETEVGTSNDVLQGVVMEKLKSKHPTKKRYKVKIESDGITDRNITTWLKFAIVACNKWNTQHRTDFDNVYISYYPSAIYAKIETVLRDLDENVTERTPISKIIFGIQNTMPTTSSDYHVSSSMIKQRFPRLIKRLNDSQINAICGSLNYNMHTIQGPPATGKSEVCSHIAYLWWRLNRDKQIKIHGVVPTNKGSLVLAQKCMQISKRMMTATKKKFKVLYFASFSYETYLVDYECKDIYSQNGLLGQICVNVMAENKFKQLLRGENKDNYMNMNKREKEAWKCEYIAKELESADMIITTFGNSLNKLLEGIQFTHAICDESNQGSLDTFLGIIRGKNLKDLAMNKNLKDLTMNKKVYRNLTHLTMAGDIRQLRPVAKSQNPLAQKSVYEDIISYLTNTTNKTNTYYTQLNTQYRSHPQIYHITTKLFYENTVDINNDMYKRREYGTLNYGELFANKKNHIQWHIYGQTQLDTSSLNQSKCNEHEAEIAVKYIRKFIIELKNKERDIAVISDYRAQIDYIKKLLSAIPQINQEEILICTTNEIEGSSKPVVIYMCCRSNKTGNIGFLNDSNRVNVALSRAEYAQIIIGDINTLQYNPVYNKIFAYHKKKGAVVCENTAYNRWSKNKETSNWIKTVTLNVPIINISQNNCNINDLILEKRKDLHICSVCGIIELEKLFCGRSCSKTDICGSCMTKYLSKYCKAAKKLRLEYPQITTVNIIDKSDLFAVDSSGISMEFDVLLGKYLMKYKMITHIREDELSQKLCYIAAQLWKDIGKNKKDIPQCFQILVEKYKMRQFEQLEFINKLIHKISNILLILNITNTCDKQYKRIDITKLCTKESNQNDIDGFKMLSCIGFKISGDNKTRTLIMDDSNSDNLTHWQEIRRALGIMRCKRNHLLQQNIMDTRFFRIMDKIKYNNMELKNYYNYNNNKYTLYLCNEFKNEYQPTTIVVAYLQCCGYSTHISNRLRTRIGQALFEINKNNPNKYNKHKVKRLDRIQMNNWANRLQLDQSIGIQNILSYGNINRIDDMLKWSYDIIELMQNALIEDSMGPYYQNIKHKNAIDEEVSFGDKLTKAGFDFITENELKERGFNMTPDYYLKKPWIVNYNGKKTEITWLDFKYYYCSATEWNIQKLNCQAIKYNQRFGPGAFIFSLGFVQPPKGLQLNCYGLLAAVPLSQYYLDRFINKRINDRINGKK